MFVVIWNYSAVSFFQIIFLLNISMDITELENEQLEDKNIQSSITQVKT